MARTEPARRLTEAHRLAQLRIGVASTLLVRRLWRLLDPTNVDAHTAEWLAAIVPILQVNRSRSAILARNYVRLYRQLELGVSADIAVPLDDQLDTTAVRVSLAVTGPAMLKQATRTHGLARAVQIAQKTSEGEALKHVLNGGRGTTINAVQHDPAALGYARGTRGNPCAFCAMLASRGPVYKGEDTAGFQPHGKCACQPEIVYDDDAPRPGQAFEALWADTTGEYSGDEKRKAFRRAYEKTQREPAAA